ncbi:MAG TPA: hypothetical protein VMJ10_30145 [Kofleriaceae bacterium]|nr:hypothetical protein [Kofleriaceae bacterium]
MHIEIHSWVDGFLALRQHAFAMRGAIELDTGARWPRTTGGDVVTIAALFDPAIRAHGSAGLCRRWQLALDEIKHEALPAPASTFAENRTLWATLEIAAIALDEAAAPVPAPATWRALFEEVGRASPRNVGPSGTVPFGPFQGVKTFDDLYLAQYKLLRDQRGADTLAPPAGFGGTAKPIPRTTNADVLQLAAYWGPLLAESKHILGKDTAMAQWKTAMTDVDRLAKPGKPSDVYPKNNELWRTLGDIAIQVAIADEAPTTWNLVVESVKDSVTHLPENIQHAMSVTAHAVGSSASAVGEGLLGLLKKPLYVGAGLVGLYLLTRNRHQED